MKVAEHEAPAGRRQLLAVVESHFQVVRRKHDRRNEAHGTANSKQDLHIATPNHLRQVGESISALKPTYDSALLTTHMLSRGDSIAHKTPAIEHPYA